MEVASSSAHIDRMKKRIGWTPRLTIGGRFAVAPVLEGGAVGDSLIVLDTKAEAQEFIDSGRADALSGKPDELIRRLAQMENDP